MGTEYAVVYEGAYCTKVLFQGTKQECIEYFLDNPEICGTYVFIQELEYA